MAKKRRRAARRSPAPAPAPARRRAYSPRKAAASRRRRATSARRVRIAELFAAAAVGFVTSRFVTPKLAEFAAKRPDSSLPKYGAGPWLLAGGYAAQRLGSGIVRTIGDTAMVSGALMLGTRFGRSSDAAEASTSLQYLLGPYSFDKKTLPPVESSVQGEDDIGAELTPGERQALAAASAIWGEDIGEDDDIGEDMLDVLAGEDDIGEDDIGDEEMLTGEGDIGDEEMLTA